MILQYFYLFRSYSFYGNRFTPNFLQIVATITKQTKVHKIEIPMDCQKLNPFDKVYGIIKNMGNVGRTYQKV